MWCGEADINWGKVAARNGSAKYEMAKDVLFLHSYFRKGRICTSLSHINKSKKEVQPPISYDQQKTNVQ
jgi:hypothetical protein